ncbi:sensor domain-containing protein [Paenibacillus wynnii]|uniref:sensor domain-containing protein n=1 Tax=Paenibacillus wynnii TaxID=268407 RepID=UPI002791E4F2|nr:bifunctional diguanylate cyclase/phosphodiesterase [Paenibacillus wynnii]MDQ0192058.1 diguanylate cyclase (GGDEF)-like protein/PAS domain S-box-containing protein [Paenibacillus wynnii]
MNMFSDQDNQNLAGELERSLFELDDIMYALDESSIVAKTDAKGVITYVNDKFCAISKYPKEELIGKTHRIINSGYHPKEFFRDMWSTIAQGCIWRGEVKNKTKDGEYYWVETTIVPSLRNGKPFQYIAIRSDITERKLVEEELKQTLKELSDVQYALDESTIVAKTDARGVITYVNDRFCEISKYSREELIGKTHRIINSGHHPKPFFREMWQTIASGNIWRGDVKNKTKDGQYYWVTTTIVPFVKDGVPFQYIAIRTDITDQKHKEELYRDREQLLSTTLNSIGDGIITTDQYGKVTFLNPIAKSITGWTFEDAEGLDISDLFVLINEDTRNEIENPVYNALRQGKIVGIDINTILINKNGVEIPIDDSAAPIIDQNEQVIGVVLVFRDMIERKRYEEKLKYNALHDMLTGLPNRRLFRDRLTKALIYANRNHENLAVLFLDLDRFKFVNDTLGHDVGDLLLKNTADLLSSIVGSSGTVSRIGGDEFTIILEKVTKDKIAETAQKIVDVFSHSLLNNAYEVIITLSIGISMYPSDGIDLETLIKNADTAMYFAKEKRLNTYQFFTPDMNEILNHKRIIENALRHAIERNELELFYQPKYDLNTSRITGVEALSRWNHPERGTIPPAEFIPIAEETGLIVSIGEWAIREACKQLKEWETQFHYLVPLSINLSMRQFYDKNLILTIMRILEETGVKPHYLELEITESIMERADESILILFQLKELGFIISIDDFGTGYSSLSYLKKLPIDTMKIDRSFISETDVNHKDYKVLSTIIHLAQSMEMNIIAEGIESEQQENALIQLGCTEGQGFFFSHPLNAEDFNEFYRTSIMNNSN